MYLPRPLAGIAAATLALLLPAACGSRTPERTVIDGYLSLTSVREPAAPAADDPMLAVLGQTARLTLRTAGTSTWNVDRLEGTNPGTAHYWLRSWTYASESPSERPDLAPDASGYLEVVVLPAMEGQFTSFVAVRFVEEPAVVRFSAHLTGDGFQLELTCPTDAMALDADGFPLAPTGLALDCTAALCREAPPLCLQGPGRLEFDLPPASIPSPPP